MLTLVRKRQLLAQLKKNIADMADYRGNADRVTCSGKDSYPAIIGERERAVLSSGIFGIISFVRRVSAHARLCTRFFLSENISKFLHQTEPREMRRSI